MRILQLVDTIEYIESNCFQHQLLKSLRQVAQVESCTLAGVERALDMGNRPVVCCLKQRSLARSLDMLEHHLGSTPVVIYDQDPWQAYIDDPSYVGRGVYERAVEQLNVKAICVTTQWWADFLKERGLPAVFVRMWMLPEYCDAKPTYEERSIPVGFVGTVHPHRQKLFDQLEDLGVVVNVQKGGLSYWNYLKELSNIQVFIHSEDSPITCEGKELNLKDSLWIKDVEAAARGCFTIRNAGAGADTYYSGCKTTFLYEDPKQVLDILDRIQKMDPRERQSLIDETVGYIWGSNRWEETARTLVTLAATEEA